MAIAADLAEKVHTLVLQGFTHEFGSPAAPIAPDAEWQKVVAAGTTLWLDTGDIDEARKLITAEFEALTTNNTLLNKEIQKGLYDEYVVEVAQALREAAPGIDDQELMLEIGFVLNATHGLKLVEQFDTKVSVELHTDLAQDVDLSVSYGLRYFDICPERFIVKVPLTPSGYLAARKLRQANVPINFTLGFSARHNHVAALLTQPNWVNVFMGRLNAFVSDHGLGPGDYVGEKATLACQRDLLALRAEGRSQTHLIGASMRTGAQVATLAGLDVFTMPTGVASGYRENPVETLSSHVQDDPEVPLNEGVSFEDFNAGTLWDIPADFRAAVDGLLAKNLDTLTPAALQDHFAEAGIPGFLPHWTESEIATITKDGKIPAFETWKDRLASGELGLDALMNAAALYSFVTDQTALDDRVRGLIG
jgi:transaldolase